MPTSVNKIPLNYGTNVLTQSVHNDNTSGTDLMCLTAQECKVKFATSNTWLHSNHGFEIQRTYTLGALFTILLIRKWAGRT